MSTEVAIIMLSIYLVAYLQVRLSRKFAVIACFAPRMLVLNAALVRLILLYPASPHDDPRYRLWAPAIMSQGHICLSIATASIPYMVPFFRRLDSDLRRTRSAKSRLPPIDEAERSKSSLWFRRHNKTKALDSWDQAADTDVHYDYVSQVSPYLPTLRPFSPLSPPRPDTPLGKQASVRGLNIYIPCRDPQRQRSLDWASPRTESSGALSPSCVSPQALLPQSFIPSRKAPSPPSRIHSPMPTVSSSCYSSRTPTPALITPYTQRFSLFPPHSASISPQPQQSSYVASAVPPIQAMRSKTVSRVTERPELLIPKSPPGHGALPVRSSSFAQTPKFSTTTHLQTPPLMTAHEGRGIRPGSIQDLTSPMGAAINGWFSSAKTKHPSPLSSPTDASLDWQSNGDQYELTSMRPIDTPRSPPPSHMRSHARVDIPRDAPHSPNDTLLGTRTFGSRTIPSLHDMRHSPIIVLRSPS
jgi:hypothetical protein